MKIISFIFILSLTISCGQRTPASSTEALQVSAAYVALDEMQYEQQHSYSYSFCSALRSKRNNMLMNQLGAHFSFQVSELDCHGVEYSSSVDANVAQVDSYLIYKSSYKKKYQSIVETDQEGVLSNFCKGILSGKEFSDSLGPNVYIRLYPMVESSIIRLELMEVSGQQIKTIRSFEVNANPQSQQYGFVVHYQESKQCLDQTKQYSFSQLLSE